MILRDRLGGQWLPFVRPLRRDDDPLAERLTATRGVEEVRPGDGEGPRVRLGVGELEDHARAAEAVRQDHTLGPETLDDPHR